MALIWACGKHGCATERLCGVWLFPTLSMVLPVGGSEMTTACQRGQEKSGGGRMGQEGSGRFRRNQDGSGWVWMGLDGSGWFRRNQEGIGRNRTE